VTGMEKLLASIKALFEPRRTPTPPPAVAATPEPAAPIPEPAEARSPEPVVIAEAAPVAEPIPAVAEPPVVAAVDEAPPEAEPVAAPVPPGVLALRLESERGSRSTFEVTKSGATIGRGPESTIQLADLSVSRKHAKITYKQGAYWLSDLGSMGGTWIDGTKLAAPRRVATGQTIDIGLCRLTVISAEAAEEAPAARGPTHAA